jgi:cation diffusion facilitator family transporter
VRVASSGSESATATSVRREERAIRLAIACSVTGALVKLSVGLWTGSMSMVSAAADSIGDLLVSIANLFVIRYSGTPADDEHNYGHAKIEGLGAMFEGGFVFAAGLFIIYESVRSYLRKQPIDSSIAGIAVMIPLLAFTAVTAWHLRRTAKATGSLVLKSDALHYASDVWINLGVLGSLLAVKITRQPIIDTVVSIAIALFMLRSSFTIVRDGFDLIMDKSLEHEVVERVLLLLNRCTEIKSFHDFKTRGGKLQYIDFHVEVRPDMTAKEMHDLFLELQAAIRSIAGANTKVLMHADPAGG